MTYIFYRWHNMTLYFNVIALTIRPQAKFWAWHPSFTLTRKCIPKLGMDQSWQLVSQSHPKQDSRGCPSRSLGQETWALTIQHALCETEFRICAASHAYSVRVRDCIPGRESRVHSDPQSAKVVNVVWRLH